MPRILPTEDIRSLSDFRSNVASFVRQVRKTGRPMVLTQHGRSAAVLLDVGAYEELMERVERLEGIRTAEAGNRADKGIPLEKVKTDLSGRNRR